MVRRQTKLADIARELDVSVGLVSLVLSGKSKENRIRDAKAQKVILKAREMGYQINQLARGLRTGRSGIIGLIVADIANPFFGKMARFIENEASKIGYHVMFGSSDENPDKLNSLINIFLSRQVDAMLIVPVKNSLDYLLELKKQPIPVVYIDRYCDGVDEDVCCADNYDGALQLTRHLLKKGYDKIGAFVLDDVLSNNIDRIKGFQAGMADHPSGSNACSVSVIGYDELESQLKPALLKTLDKGCEALFFANNSIALKSIQILNEMGIAIGEDPGLVSFDNPDAFSVSTPGVTCYEQPIELICSRAVKTIYEKIENSEEYVMERRIYKGELIIRNSC